MFKPDNVDINCPLNEEEKMFNLNMLHIYDTVAGATLFKSKNEIVFILIPREEVLKFQNANSNKFKIITALEYMRKNKGKCQRGKKCHGRQINRGTKYTIVGPAPNRGGPGIITTFPRNARQHFEWNILLKLLNFVEDKALKYIPTKYLHAISKIKECQNILGFLKWQRILTILILKLKGVNFSQVLLV